MQTIEDFCAKHPDISIDVSISYSCGTPTDKEFALIRPGGYVLANNWHESANKMSEQSNFKLVGAVDQQGAALVGIADALRATAPGRTRA